MNSVFAVLPVLSIVAATLLFKYLESRLAHNRILINGGLISGVGYLLSYLCVSSAPGIVVIAIPLFLCCSFCTLLSVYFGISQQGTRAD